LNASVWPSGLKRGNASAPGGLESGVAVPPSRLTIHRSFPYTKQTRSLLTAG